MSDTGGNIYQWFLKDPRWQNLRYWVLRRAGGRCEQCGKKGPLQIHHWFYGEGRNGKVKKPWDYKPRQLTAVCRRCHIRLHHRHQNKLQGDGLHSHCGGILSTLRRWLPDAVKDRFRSHFSVRYELQPAARKTLAQYGNMNLESVQVCREPIQSGISFALNAMSFGRFNREMAANGYDKMFHLFMSIKLLGGPTVLMERNEVIVIKTSDKKGVEQINVPLNGAPLRLNGIWEKALQAVGTRIYEYDPIQNNCQRFVFDVLAANSLMTPAIQTFTMQKADNLLPMYAQKFGRWTTDMAAKFNHVLFGHGRGGVFPTAPPPSEDEQDSSEDPGALSARSNQRSTTTTVAPGDIPMSSFDYYYRQPGSPDYFYTHDPFAAHNRPSTSAPPPEEKKGTGWRWQAFKSGVKQGVRHPFDSIRRKKGGVWPPGPGTAPPPPWGANPDSGDLSIINEFNHEGSATVAPPPELIAPGQVLGPEEVHWDAYMPGDEDDDMYDPNYTTTEPPPESKGSGKFRSRYRGGKYAHSSKGQTRAQQNTIATEDAENLSNAIQEHMDSVKGFINAFKEGDEKAAMQIVMELTSKTTGNPATAGLIPLLAGTADLISRHTNPLDPNYHQKTRQYLDAAFSVIPVVGPILENAIAPMQPEKFNAPADSYTGQIVADPSKARKFDGNLWMQDWKHADPTGYWKIKTADEMRAYNQKYGTHYTVYGSGFKPLQTDPTYIGDGIWLGSDKVTHDPHWLKTHVGAVLSVGGRNISKLAKQLGIDYYRHEIDDEPSADMYGLLPCVVKTIDHCISSGKPTLVHCQMGISRSPTVVAAYHIWKHKRSAGGVLKDLKHLRHCVDPNPGFLKQLYQWDRCGREVICADCPRRSWWNGESEWICDDCRSKR